MCDVALFDLDGTLIRNAGYRVAMAATMNHFGRQMGVAGLAPEEDDLALLESLGMTNEWDMLPLCLAVVFETGLAQRSHPSLPGTLDAALEWMAAQAFGALRVDYAGAFRRLAVYLEPHLAPADAILIGCLAHPSGSPLPHVAAGGLLAALFAGKEDPAQSATTRVFQQYILGTEVFQRTYGLPAEFAASSALQEHDQPLLEADLCRRLRERHIAGQLPLAVLTARPSLPPLQVAQPGFAGSPEAEMAAELLGWDALPLMAQGKVRYLAQMVSAPVDLLLKPAPVQALAALAVACGADDLAALAWAGRLCAAGRTEALDVAANGVSERLPQRFTIHVFEDSSTGVVAVQRAVAVLRAHGLQADWCAWGVADQPDKVRSLQALGAQVFGDVNQAVRQSGLAEAR